MAGQPKKNELNVDIDELKNKALQNVLERKASGEKLAPDLDAIATQALQNVLSKKQGQPAEQTITAAASQAAPAQASSMPPAQPALQAQQGNVQTALYNPDAPQSAVLTGGTAPATPESAGLVTPPAPESNQAGQVAAGQASRDDTDLGAQPAATSAPQPLDTSPEGLFQIENALAEKQLRSQQQANQAKTDYDLKGDEIDLRYKEGMARLADDYQRKVQEAAEQHKTRIAGQFAAYRQAVDDYHAIDPNPWADRGTSFTIASALSQAMVQMGKGILGKDGPNVATQIINDALERDLRVQQNRMQQGRENVGMQSSMLTYMQGMFDDEKELLDATRGALWDSVARIKDAQLARLAPEKRTAEALQLAANIDAKANELLSKPLDNYSRRDQTRRQNDLHLYAAKTQRMAVRLADEARREKTALTLQADQGMGILKGEQPIKDKEQKKTFHKLLNIYQGQIGPAYLGILDEMKQPLDSWNALDANAKIEKLRGWAAPLSEAARQFNESGAHLSPEESSNNKSMMGLPGYLEARILAKDLTENDIKNIYELMTQGAGRIEKKVDTTIFNATGKPLKYWNQKHARMRQEFEESSEATKYGQ